MSEILLDVKNLRKSFKQGNLDLHIIEDLNLTAKRGESIAILGQSGSGKTTLLSLLAGLDSPDLGSIEIAGRNIVGLSESELSLFRAQHMGIVFQQFHLMSTLTALENVALPLEIFKKKNATENALEALKSVSLLERKDQFPSTLSGGEKQRVAIARAFVVQPDILLADEPSGSLDTATGNDVMKLLFDITKKQNNTIILVTHNIDLAKNCDQIFELKQGSLHRKEA